MAKSGLSNNLLDKTVTPAFNDHGVTCPHGALDVYTPEMHPCWPKNFRPNYSRECYARITAVWTSDDKVMVALMDPSGNCGEAYLNHVKVKI